MNAIIDQLAPGDVIAIAYNIWIGTSCSERMAVRWVNGTVIDCTVGARPLVRLADGQVTELRGYMPWRIVTKAPLSAARKAA
jgi:hypothetical protein